MQSKLTMHPIRNDFNVAVAVDAITIGHICHILLDFQVAQVAQFIVPWTDSHRHCHMHSRT